ncbi:hypothetical protein COCSADRAFT_34668 [Bipolaris sorokiniana ND90Pr]|uniref:Uncharacterized protein n=1 Tax=Cochliobolus sativus (strain ND90Pr / ATCC 201652) TaxID=665912 RepID=M2RH66_COCSN|nr:uncharacterized protein COCSADRAFT_34668 [Bipolaris sorokiniana ND90Pr]EMD66074.1 hypothetical protein COCSADRAFT_34668 [Bipolaris sorokiniana ND90Pr]
MRSEQNASIHFSSFYGIPRAFILYSSLFLHTPLYAPLTSKLIRLTIRRPRHAV